MPVKVATRVANMSESVTLAIDAKAKAMKAEGIDVINFGAGEPDFDTPEQVKAAAKAALDAGKTKYVASGGLPELKAAICAKLAAENGLEYKPSEVLVSTGAKHSLYNIVMALVEPGDEVIIPAPYWVSYYDMVRGAEGVPIVVETTAEAEFKMSPEQLRAAITPKTVAVIINTPSNPTGGVYTEAELRALADVVIEKDILCISDEIYEKLMYDGVKHFSIAAASPAMKERTITVNGFSKAFSMTGWRLGYLAGPQKLVSAMNVLQSHSTSNATTFSQWGAIEALNSTAADVERMLKAFDERRQYLVGALNALPGVKCNTPRGAFYAFPDMSSFFGKKTPEGKVISGSMDLAEYVLSTANVGIVPGAAFGAEKHQRLSYATSMQNLQNGIERLGKALAALQ